jgi:hypothetical protein
VCGIRVETKRTSRRPTAANNTDCWAGAWMAGFPSGNDHVTSVEFIDLVDLYMYLVSRFIACALAAVVSLLFRGQ